MELRIEINERVIEWLASMGYPVAGMPQELLLGMLLREARQWQLSPEALESLIEEGAGNSIRNHGSIRNRGSAAIPVSVSRVRPLNTLADVLH